MESNLLAKLDGNLGAPETAFRGWETGKTPLTSR
jgi:hypothetical protein